MYLLGYSLNNLSLMALTLSVGFVVDDAIVMLENIVRHMEMGETRMEAALLGVAGDRLHDPLDDDSRWWPSSFPVLFMGGIVGRLLHEFSVTIVVAILISGFVSLTLTPMLGSRFLQARPRRRHGLLYRALGRRLQRDARAVRASRCGSRMRFRLVTLRVASSCWSAPSTCSSTMPTGFIPSQDSGFMFGGTLGPQDISFDSMAKHNHAVGEIVRAHPDVAGRRRIRAGQGNQGFVFARMKPREERTLSVDQIIESCGRRWPRCPA